MNRTGGGALRATIALIACLGVLAPSGASALTPPTAPPGAAAPPSGALVLSLPGVFVVHRQAVTVRGRPQRIQGTVRPFVPGQSVTVEAFVGGRQIQHAQLQIKPARGGSAGVFTARLVSQRAGLERIVVTHSPSTAQAGFTATRTLSVLVPRAGFGARGRFVQLIQQRLAALHLYLRQTGVFDAGTGLALDAYHRLLGWGTSERLGGATISALLRGRGRFHLRFPGHGHHAEGNLGKQLLALADGGRVRFILPISSGKPSTPTILGDFRIYERTPGYLPDGMYYSDFFSGGYAIHGYDPAPDYPASHGCMRLPIRDAIPVFDWLHMGNWVDVYL